MQKINLAEFKLVTYLLDEYRKPQSHMYADRAEKVTGDQTVINLGKRLTACRCGIM
jgi:hypothetical protein